MKRDNVGRQFEEQRSIIMRLIAVIILFLVLGCEQKLFFVYDEVIHYHSNIQNKDILGLNRKENKSFNDSILKGIVSGYIPRNINDTTFLNHISKLGFKHKKVSPLKFKSLNGIFMKKGKPDEIYTVACEYAFRNVIVFKNKSKIVGITKICFDCEQHQTVGSRENTNYFGMDGDYKRLKHILE